MESQLCVTDASDSTAWTYLGLGQCIIAMLLRLQC